MMIALVVPARGGRVVTRAKKLMSDLIRGQGRVPAWPMPSRVVVLVLVRTGVVATMRVRVRGWVGVGGGIVAVVVVRVDGNDGGG